MPRPAQKHPQTRYRWSRVSERVLWHRQAGPRVTRISLPTTKSEATTSPLLLARRPGRSPVRHVLEAILAVIHPEDSGKLVFRRSGRVPSPSPK